MWRRLAAWLSPLDRVWQGLYQLAVYVWRIQIVFFTRRTNGAAVSLQQQKQPALPAVDPGLVHINHGIDCSCYFSENFFVRTPIAGHFTFTSAEEFEREYAGMLAALSDAQRDALIANLEAEAERRRSQPSQAVQRKARIAAEYVPTHPQLWTLQDDFLHPDFVALVASAARADGSWRPPPSIADGVYTLPIFSTKFCKLLYEELKAFSRSGLPCGRPNSMNRFGMLLDELGLTPGLITPLVRDYVRPLAACLAPLAAVGGGAIDHHKAFVVAYRMGEDEELSQHFDNAEVTLNANLGVDFEGGELVFYGHKDRAGDTPVACHEWTSESGGLEIGHGVLHLGAQVDGAHSIA
eukprot:CAMPEP_0174696928 /NCGR_PEP_ID=MMETSP1094-20130205/2931_1 /TAXON_ID=156173 /ORGANISM="Chrysochromulina brevifilum, Strain UTEX LB 985" /LENGTH=351 /DNA_ID=CAMNT_0015893803 /DNA_START=51 /DNA_END=1106 /DNA_ORIENTATION=+